MAEAVRTQPAPAAAASTGPPPVVIDLGRKKRKDVRRLRKGRGKLVDKISGVLDGMRASGAIAKDAQAVIVVVREKQDRGPLF